MLQGHSSRVYRSRNSKIVTRLVRVSGSPKRVPVFCSVMVSTLIYPPWDRETGPKSVTKYNWNLKKKESKYGRFSNRLSLCYVDNFCPREGNENLGRVNSTEFDVTFLYVHEGGDKKKRGFTTFTGRDSSGVLTVEYKPEGFWVEI